MEAVQEYLAVWARIGQDLQGQDWDQLWAVAGGDEAAYTIRIWNRWLAEGWHLEGEPAFIPMDSYFRMSDGDGEYYTVRGCFVIEGSHIVDDAGNPGDEAGRQERGVNEYSVLRSPQDTYVVTNSSSEEGTC